MIGRLVLDWSIGLGLRDWSGIGRLERISRADWRWSDISCKMDCLNLPRLRHFDVSPIVLVPLTKWGVVRWIDPVLA